MEPEEEKITAGQLVDVVDKAFDEFVADLVAAAEKLGRAMLPSIKLAGKQGLGDSGDLVASRLQGRADAASQMIEDTLDRIGREHGMDE